MGIPESTNDRVKFHRHLGIYGICRNGNKLLTVRKARGPYRNRYDLPGGSIEENETVVQALHREFDEETGMKINIIGNAGTAEFIVKYELRENTHIQHIALFFEVDVNAEEIDKNNVSDDTTGIEWVQIDRINEVNSSPLVITAKEYINTNQIEYLSRTYNTWKVKEDEAWGGN